MTPMWAREGNVSETAENAVLKPSKPDVANNWRETEDE